MEPDRRNQVSDLYHAALQRPVEDRRTYLVEACNGMTRVPEIVGAVARYTLTFALSGGSSCINL